MQEVLDRHLSQSPLSPPDRRLATQLAYGVLRRRGTLFALLKPLISREPHQVEAWLWDVLGLGAFQLAFLQQMPAHAALHETVELAERFGRPAGEGLPQRRAAALSRVLTNDPAPGPAADALPMEDGTLSPSRAARLPDPAAHPMHYFSAAFAFPEWLAERWLQRFPAEECHRLGFWFAGPAPLTLRCNPLRDRARHLPRRVCSEGHRRRAGIVAAGGAAARAGADPRVARLRGRLVRGAGRNRRCASRAALAPAPGVASSISVRRPAARRRTSPS